MSVADDARDLIERAIRELDHERNRLEMALQSLDGGLPSTGRRRRRARRSARRRGKRAARGKRREQFLAAVQEQPGITVPQAAKKIGVPASQMYPVARKLHKDRAISKRGARYTIKAQPKAKKSAKAT